MHFSWPVAIAFVLGIALALPTAAAEPQTLQFKGVDGINLEMELRGDSTDTRIGTLTHERFGELELFTAGKDADGARFVIRRKGARAGAKGVAAVMAANHVPGGTITVQVRDTAELESLTP